MQSHEIVQVVRRAAHLGTMDANGGECGALRVLRRALSPSRAPSLRGTQTPHDVTRSISPVSHSRADATASTHTRCTGTTTDELTTETRYLTLSAPSALTFTLTSSNKVGVLGGLRAYRSMARYEVKARRYTLIPDEPLRRRLSWPPRKNTKPQVWNPTQETYDHLLLTMDPNVPADDPGYDADMEDNLDRDPFMACLRWRRLALKRDPTPPPTPPPEEGAWRYKSFIYGE